ncbi:hypothetical protein [Gordonia sp. N1V]|uniref:hypothetical protein n=1 Tax=Gordonia sp. N1V TaxID=3034163 RepID=UPI0023E31D74|nr:hypothetical protein [Gordonia sp. N1V]MDF3280854.1 hypothetical protein [Gordonia sp. N1V]
MTALDHIEGDVRAYIAIKQQIAELTKLSKKLQANIVSAIGNGDEATIGGEVVLTYATTKRTAFSQAILKRDYPEVVDLCKETTEVRSLRVAGES